MPVNEGVQAKKLTETGIVTTAGKAGLLYGYVLKGGTGASSILFKNGGTDGTILWEDFIKAQTVAGDDCARVTFLQPIFFTTDIYATLAGAAATITIAYKEIS